MAREDHRTEGERAAGFTAGGEPSPRPPRVMGFSDLLMFYVVTGVSLRWVATAAGAGPSSIVVWIAAWLCFYVPLALSVVELSSRYPQEGGLYVWSKRAFGDFSGFMSGWAYWTNTLPYFPAVLYFAAGNLLFLRNGRWTDQSESRTYYMLFSVLALAGITALNIVGLNRGKWLHNIGAFGMWMPAVILVLMAGYSWRNFGSATSFALPNLVPSTHLKDVLFWAALTFSICGCETASFMTDEIKDPRRNIPRALLASGLIITFCYIGSTVAVLVALPSGEVSDLQGIMQAISKTAMRLGWWSVVPVAALLIALSNLGAASGFLAAGSRLPFVAGLDRFLPPAFGRLHPRWGTPYVALLVQLAAGTLFVVLSQAGTSVQGAYDVLVSMGIITTFIPYLYLFAAMFKLQREAAGPEVFRVPGGRPAAKFLACLGFATTLFSIVVSLVPGPGETNKVLAVIKVVGLTGVLLGTGWLVYLLGNRKRRAAAPN